MPRRGSNWFGSGNTGAYQSDYRYHAAGTGQNKAIWTFQGWDANTDYRVWTTWVASSSRASNAPFAVFDNTTALGTVRLNQQTSPASVTLDGRAWQTVGTYRAASGKLVVQLSDDANGSVIADAVGIGTPCPPLQVWPI